MPWNYIQEADLYAAVVPEESYLYRAGLRSGDKVLRLDDDAVPGPEAEAADSGG